MRKSILGYKANVARSVRVRGGADVALAFPLLLALRKKPCTRLSNPFTYLISGVNKSLNKLKGMNDW